MLRLFVLVMVLTIPALVSAGTNQDLGVVVVTAENGFGNGCSHRLASTCAFNVTGDSPQNLTIDTYQRVHYVGIATNGTHVEEATGLVWPLPDTSIGVSGSDIFIRHFLFQNASEAANGVRPPSPAGEYYYWRWTSDNITLHYYGPSAKERSAAPENRTWALAHEEGGLGYDQQGPHNAPGGSSTDRYLAPASIWCRGLPEEGACRRKVEDLVETQRNLTPNLVFGVEFYDAEVATDPRFLDGSGEAERRSLPSEGWTRAAPPLAVPMPRQNPIATIAQPLGRPTHPMPTPGPSFPQDHSTLANGVYFPLPPPPVSPLVPLAAAATAVALVALAAALYSRFRSRDALLASSEPRRRIVEAVRAQPGVTVGELVRVVGITRTAVLYHLRMLEQARLVEMRSEGGRCFVFPPAALPRGGVPVHLARHPVLGRLVAELAALEGAVLARRELHARMGEVPQRTRNHLLRTLVEHGVLVPVSLGRAFAVARRAGGGPDAVPASS